MSGQLLVKVHSSAGGARKSEGSAARRERTPCVGLINTTIGSPETLGDTSQGNKVVGS